MHTAFSFRASLLRQTASFLLLSGGLLAACGNDTVVPICAGNCSNAAGSSGGGTSGSSAAGTSGSGGASSGSAGASGDGGTSSAGPGGSTGDGGTSGTTQGGTAGDGGSGGIAASSGSGGSTAGDGGAGTGGSGIGGSDIGGSDPGMGGTGGSTLDCGALEKCGSVCVDLKSDNTNCGACGKTCDAGLECKAGACVCSAGLAQCGGKCVNTMTDPQNCGACGTSCGGDLVCAGGECTIDEGKLKNQLRAYWPMDGNGQDLSGSALHLNLMGSPSFAAGRVGSALDLKGNSSQYAQRPGTDLAISLVSTDFTIQVWVNYHSLSPAEPGAILQNMQGPTGPGWTIQTTSQTTYFYGPSEHLVYANTSLSTNTWHHQVYVKKGASVTMWIDGIIAVVNTPSNQIAPSSKPLTIGRSFAEANYPYPLNGMVDECAIWARALSADEIAYLYNGGVGRKLPL